MVKPILDRQASHGDPASGSDALSFRLDLRAGRLLRGGAPIALRPKTWAVLRYLADRPGVLVTKDELLDAVWPETAVSEAVLSKSIGELRTAFGDDFKTPRFIETVQRRGFRLVTPLAAPDEAPQLPLRELAPLDARPATPFVGRAHELRQLTALFAKASA